MESVIIKKSKMFENRGNCFTIYDCRDSKIKFVQDKVSRSNIGVIRGFHGDDKTWKLISCLHGKIQLVTYNVDIDIKNTYILDGEDSEFVSVLVPPRTLNAHQCLTKYCIFHYKWSEFYTGPEDQWSVYYNDSDISPHWDLTIASEISDRDSKAQDLKELKKSVCR